jgi:hypothetical protein
VPVKKSRLTSVQETTMEREQVSATQSLAVVPAPPMLVPEQPTLHRAMARGKRPERLRDFEIRTSPLSTKPSDAELSDAKYSNVGPSRIYLR